MFVQRTKNHVLFTFYFCFSFKSRLNTIQILVDFECIFLSRNANRKFYCGYVLSQLWRFKVTMHTDLLVCHNNNKQIQVVDARRWWERATTTLKSAHILCIRMLEFVLVFFFLLFAFASYYGIYVQSRSPTAYLHRNTW